MTQFKFVLLSLLLLLSNQAASGQRGQTLKNNILVDHDFKFRLAGPKSWRTVDEAEARKVVPDARGGIFNIPAVFSVIIVEPAPKTKVEEWAESIVEQIDIEDKKIEKRESLKFAGQEAMRFITVGTSQGIRCRFQHVIFTNSGYLYQVVCWGLAVGTKADGSDFDPVLKAFSLLRGQVTSRKIERAQQDRTGIGWEVREGTFTSAALGFTLKACRPWHLVTGDELKQTNPQAEVGLFQDNAYVVVIGEQIADADHKSFAEKLLKDVVAGQKLAGEPSRVTFKVAGVDVPFVKYKTPSPAFTLYHGVLFNQDACLQIQAWSLTSFESAAKISIQGALASMRLLNQEQQDKVRRRMAQTPFLDREVGLGYSLRRGVYRNFEHGLIWKRPMGFWRLAVGEEARAQNPFALFCIEEPAAGLFGLCIADQDLGDAIGKKYHALVVDKIQGANKKMRPCKLAGHDGWLTSFDYGVPVGLRYRLYTASVGTRGIQMHIWGLPGNMEKSTAAIEGALAGLKFTGSSLPTTSRDGALFTDHRMGFTLKLPTERTKLVDFTPPPMRAVGSMYSFAQDPSSSVAIVGMCVKQDFQDLSWFATMVKTSFAKHLLPAFDGPPTTGHGTIAGQKCEWQRFSNDQKTTMIYFFSKDGTFYALVVIGNDEFDLETGRQRLALL